MDSYRLVIFPMIVLTLLQLVTQSAVPDNSTLDNTIDGIFCQWPDYNTGINATSITCSIIDHPDPYPEDNTFGFPIGWFTFVADIATSLFYRIGLAFVTLGIYLFPVSQLTSILPTAVVSALTALFGILYVMLIVGAYKLISPFVGR